MSEPAALPHDPALPLGDLTPEPTGATVTEPARDVPVLTECDVAVLGGGPAGVCAAAAAARAGKRVVLVERYGYLGGMATAGWVSIFHTLYGTDKATKVIGGLAEEFIRRMQRLGGVRNQSDDGETGGWDSCGETARFAYDDLAVGSGVRLLLHARLAGALADGRRVTAALVETKSGRGAILADAFVDCTGDADLVRAAGAAVTLGSPEGKCQAPTLVFRTRGQTDDAASLREMQAFLSGRPMDYRDEPFSCHVWGIPCVLDPSERMIAGTRVLNVNCADARDFTRAEIDARYQLRWMFRQFGDLPGWEAAHLVAMAHQIGVRETYRIVADRTITREDLLSGRRWPDPVCQGTYPVDIHQPDRPGILFEYLDGRRRWVGAEARSKWDRWDGQPEDAPPRDTLCWQVPYGCLVPRDLDNVLAAGRCIGADHEAAGATRVMINCMQLGHAAGTAAALAKGGEIRAVDAPALTVALTEAGMPLLPVEDTERR